MRSFGLARLLPLLACALLVVGPGAGASGAAGGLAPDGDFELSPFAWYYTHGSGTFTYASDRYVSPTHSLKIVSEQAEGQLARWMTNTDAITVTAGRTYGVAAQLMKLGGRATLAVSFWNASRVWVGTTLESAAVPADNAWTAASLEATAPPGSWYMRVEFRLSGPGTLWIDDVSVNAAVEPPPPAANLVPNGDVEAQPDAAYYTHGTGTFSWATDASHSPLHSLKLVSTQPADGLARWMTRTDAIRVAPGVSYDASAWLKTSGVAQHADLTITFWDAGQSYLGLTASSATTMVGTTDWTEATVRATAPPGSASVRVELRLYGPGTVWGDDLWLAPTLAPQPPAAVVPVVTIVSLDPAAVTATSSSTLTWHASDNGPYVVRVGGSDCATGSVVEWGDYATAPAGRATVVAAASLPDGQTTLRVCVTNASGTGEATTTVAKQEGAALTGVAAVSTGAGFTCALTNGGAVECWGSGYGGQLGNGTLRHRSTPVVVTGLGSGAVAVSADTHHACALMSGGGVKCWGQNTHGEVGDGTTIDRLEPVDVVGLGSGVTAISAGAGHACALMSDGGVKCWGDNNFGGLGVPGGYRTTPVDVTGLTSRVAAVSAGRFHTCAVTTAGGLKCWGDNSAGQLGVRYSAGYVPVDVTGLTSGVAAVSAGGNHTCALTSDGGVKCWGENPYGELGDGTATTRYTPLDVTGLTSGVAAVSAGGSESCALTSAGGVKCWGINDFGGLGNGTRIRSSVPVDVPGLAAGVLQIATSSFDTCALTESARLECWGDNEYGTVGDGTTVDRLLPTTVHPGGPGAGASLVPNSDVEASPTSYFANGPATFSWTTDAAHSPEHALELVATQPGTLTRVMTSTGAVPAVAGKPYDTSVWLKTAAAGYRAVGLTLTFWTGAGVYIGGSAVGSEQVLTGTTDWAQIALSTTAPPGAASLRVEVRLTGPGTVWADDLKVVQG